MDIVIREAGVEQAAKLAELYSAHLDEQCRIDKAFVRSGAFNPRDFIDAMLNPKLNQFFAADCGDSMVGFVRLSILYADGMVPLDEGVNRLEAGYVRRIPLTILRKISHILSGLIERIEARRSAFRMLEPSRTGYIADIYVVPGYRRKGVGRMLVEESMKWFVLQGISAVELNVLADNESGKQFWESLGFKPRRILARKTLAEI